MKKILWALLLLSAYQQAHAQAGSLDNSFGNGGLVRTDFPVDYAYLYDNDCRQVLVRPDGSFYLVLEMNRQTLITHRLQNGALDLSYGVQGYSAPAPFRAPSAVMQPDGKIIVGGSVEYPNRDFGLARFNPDGFPDKSFSGDGELVIDFGLGTEDKLNGLALQADGKIVIVGSHWIARFNPDGVLDNSFSDDGRQLTSIDDAVA